MMGRKRFPGETVPNTTNHLWFIVEGGHVLETVDLSKERIFPPLPGGQYYVAWG